MNNWKSIPLGKIAEFRNGVNFDNSSFGKGLKVINVADFKDRMYPNYSLLGELDSTAKWHDESFLKEGDIVFVRSNGNKNLIGRSIYIKNLPNQVKVTYSASFKAFTLVGVRLLSLVSSMCFFRLFTTFSICSTKVSFADAILFSA